MIKKTGAKSRILSLLLENVSVPVHRDRIREVAGVHEPMRTLRTLRQEGWDIKIDRKEGTYTLMSKEKKEGVTREPVSIKIRYKILSRDNHTCRGCGVKASDGIDLHIDHKTPVDLGGTNDEDNLQTLCSKCNLGKKHLFEDQDEKLLRKALRETSAEKRLTVLIEGSPNRFIDITILGIVGRTRDWTRSIRTIREKQGWDIRHEKKDGRDGYTWYKN